MLIHLSKSLTTISELHPSCFKIHGKIYRILGDDFYCVPTLDNEFYWVPTLVKMMRRRFPKKCLKYK